MERLKITESKAKQPKSLQDITNGHPFKIIPQLMSAPLEENNQILSSYNVKEEPDRPITTIKFKLKSLPLSKPYRLNEVERTVTEESS